jgi:hypothetical protein
MRLRPIAVSTATALVLAGLVAFAPTATAATIGSENFDGLSSGLQPRTTETGIPADLLGWTRTAPNGWTVTSADSMTGKGMDEWRGWSFATPRFWSAAQTGQGRESFTKSSGVLAVAENDEWDDANNPGDQLFESTLTSPAYPVAGKSTVYVNYDQNYRQTGPQVAAVDVSFDGGTPQRQFTYSTATLGDQVYRENETIAVPVKVPAGAQQVKVSWVIEDASNDWYWAIDNMSLNDEARAGAIPPLPKVQTPDDLPNGTSRTKVLFVDMDGMRWDKMQQAGTPNLAAVGATGQFGPAYIQDNAIAGTNSGPGHSSMFTGVWPDKHNVLDNSFNGYRKAQYPDFITRAESLKPELSTFTTLDWTPLNTYLIDRPDVKLQQNGANQQVTDRQSTDAALDVLKNHNPDLMMVYLHDVDATGHGLGSDSPDYIDAIRRVDAKFGELTAAVKARSTYRNEQWLIVAATDHGQTGFGHGGDQHTSRQGWILAAGPGIPKTPKREWRQVDIMPTVYHHLGLPIDPSWGLDGVAIGSRSTDPFDTVAATSGVVDEAVKPAGVGGWTTALPSAWSRVDRTPAGTGVTEYRGWRLMTGEFWTTSEEGQGRGSFVRGRDVIAVADPDEWNDKGDPVSGGALFDSTLTTPWLAVRGKTGVQVDYFSHYKQVAAGQPQKAEVVAEFDNGVKRVLWSADAANGATFDISKAMHLVTAVPNGAGKVRVSWQLKAGNNGYWAIDGTKLATL